MAEPEEIVEEVFENQRYIPIEGFSGNYLLPGERPTWSDSTGAPVAYHPHGDGREQELTHGWEWVDEWAIDYDYTECDEEGFSYGVDFNNVQTRLQRRTSLDHSGFTDFVRRRKWRRTRRLVKHEEIKPFDESLIDMTGLKFKKGPLEGGVHCWSEPPARVFEVRSKTYINTMAKQPSKPAVLTLRNMDFFVYGDEFCEERFDNFAAHPESYIQRAIRAGDKSYFIVVHFQMNPHHLCCTWAVDAEKQAAAGPEFNLLWERFLDGEDEYRNSRFKVSPAIAEGNWLIKRAVGSKPALLATKLTHRYFKTDRYFEIDCDIHSSYMAGSIVSVLKSYAYVLSIDVGFSIEGRTKSELPELIWGCFRLTKPDLERSRTLQDAYPDEYVEAMRRGGASDAEPEPTAEGADSEGDASDDGQEDAAQEIDGPGDGEQQGNGDTESGEVSATKV